jgi:hypothetical protein
MLVCCALKMIRGGIKAQAALTHSIAVIHSGRPAIIFQLDLSRMLANALKRLTGSDSEARLVLVVDTFWWVVMG